MRKSSYSNLALGLAFLLGATACEDNPVQTATPRTTGARAIVTTTDFSTGALSVASLDGSGEVDVAVAPIHSDAVVRVFDGLVYVVNRFQGDNIQILDPGNGFALVRQFSVGNGSNPHDIAVVNPTKAYVTRYDEEELWIVNPASGAHVGTIDLSPFADDDGSPEMDHITLHGGRLFVTLQRFDTGTSTPAGVSYVVVIDAASDEIVDVDADASGTQAIALVNANPFSEIQPDAFSGNLYVACVGRWGEMDAGVEWVTPGTMTSGGTILSGVDAGGDITDVEIVSILADRTATSPGLRIYVAESGKEKTTAPLDVGLPPFDITFIR
jgi:hypothetical protein